MKHLITSMDHGYINEVANYLEANGVVVHIGNVKTSTTPGSKSYQQSIYIVSNSQVEKAHELMMFREKELNPDGVVSEPEFILFIKSLFHNKYFLVVSVFLVIIILAF